MKFKVLALSVLVVLVTIGISIIPIANSAQEELAKEQVLDVGLSAEDIGPMDPHQPALAQDTPIWDAVWEELVTYKIPGDVTSGIAPALAESWETSEDGLVWTFHLRKGVQFHKGYGEMTAEDVKFSFDRVRDPERSGLSGQPPWPFVADVKVVDKYTIELTLTDPIPDLLFYLAHMQTGTEILCKKAVEEKGDKIKGDLIGTGPWMWEEYVPHDHIALVRNLNYWRGEPTLEKIIFYYMPSEESRTMAFLTGELDSVKAPFDQAWINRVRDAGKIVEALGPGAAGEFMFSLTKPPLDKWLVRAAIAYAIDREEIVEAMGKDIASPQPSVVPDTWVYGTYEGIPEYKYNPELAKKLLAAAGYPDGFELETFASPRSYYRTQFEVIQAQLKRVGIDLKLNMVDHTTFHANQDKKDLNTLILFGNGGWNGEQHLWQFWHSSAVITKPTGMLNMSHYGDVVGSIDDILEEAKGKDPEVKAVLYAKAQRKLLVDLAGYPTILLLNPLARQPYFDLGYQPTSITTGSWYNLTWKARILKH